MNQTILFIGIIFVALGTYVAATDIKNTTAKLVACLGLWLVLYGAPATLFGLETFAYAAAWAILTLCLAVAAFFLGTVKVPKGEMHVYQPRIRFGARQSEAEGEPPSGSVTSGEFHIVTEGDLQPVWLLFEELRSSIPAAGSHLYEWVGRGADETSEKVNEFGDPVGSFDIQLRGGHAYIPVLATAWIDYSDKGLHRYLNAKRPEAAIDDQKARKRFIAEKLRQFVGGRLEQVLRDVDGLDENLTRDYIERMFIRDTSSKDSAKHEAGDIGKIKLTEIAQNLGLSKVEISFGDPGLSKLLKEKIDEMSETTTTIQNATLMVEASGLEKPDKHFARLLEDQTAALPALEKRFAAMQKPEDYGQKQLLLQQAQAAAKLKELEAVLKSRFKLTEEKYRDELLAGQRQGQRDALSVPNLRLWQDYSEARARHVVQVENTSLAITATELEGSFKQAAAEYRKANEEKERELGEVNLATKAKKLYGEFATAQAAYEQEYAKAFDKAREFVGADRENTQRFVLGGDFQGAFAGLGAAGPEAFMRFLAGQPKPKK